MDDVERTRLRALYEERVTAQERYSPGWGALWSRLCERVLVHGGELVVPPCAVDADTARLAEGAELKVGRVRHSEGEPSACHDNVIALWRRGRVEAIGTGYALSEDGLWRRHSWGVLDDGTLVETTEARVRYVGVTLRGEVAEAFARG